MVLMGNSLDFLFIGSLHPILFQFQPKDCASGKCDF